MVVIGEGVGVSVGVGVGIDVCVGVGVGIVVDVSAGGDEVHPQERMNTPTRHKTKRNDIFFIITCEIFQNHKRSCMIRRLSIRFLFDRF